MFLVLIARRSWRDCLRRLVLRVLGTSSTPALNLVRSLFQFGSLIYAELDRAQKTQEWSNSRSIVSTSASVHSLRVARRTSWPVDDRNWPVGLRHRIVDPKNHPVDRRTCPVDDRNSPVGLHNVSVASRNRPVDVQNHPVGPPNRPVGPINRAVGSINRPVGQCN